MNGSNDDERSPQKEQLADALYADLVNKAVNRVRALPENCRQSGEDSVLADVWEEFKYQLQREESVMFEFYEDTIRQICVRVMIPVHAENRRLLWPWTNAWVDWYDDDGPPPDVVVEEAVSDEVYRRLCSRANNEDLKVDPDVERDRERYEDDIAPFRNPSDDNVVE